MEETRIAHHRAAASLTNAVPTALPTDTVGKILTRIQTHADVFETLHYVYILNPRQQLKGVISMKELLRSPKAVEVRGRMEKRLITIGPGTDRINGARLALKYGLKAIPVVDTFDRFLGVLTPDQILHDLHTRQLEQALHSAGMRFRDPAHALLKATAFQHIEKRAPWLLVGLAGGLLGAGLMERYSAALQTEFLLAAFVPAILYISNALGMQTQTLFVRALALEPKLNLRWFVWREFKIGIYLSILFAAISAMVTLVLWQQHIISIIIGLAFAATMLVGMTTALMLTCLLRKLKVDPGVAGGPFATVMSDLLSLATYVGISVSLIPFLK